VLCVQDKLPGMEHLMEVDEDHLMFFVVTMLLLALCLKVSLTFTHQIKKKSNDNFYIAHISIPRMLTRAGGIHLNV
jgi:hypothetical protein